MKTKMNTVTTTATEEVTLPVSKQADMDLACAMDWAENNIGEFFAVFVGKARWIVGRALNGTISHCLTSQPSKFDVRMAWLNGSTADWKQAQGIERVM